MPWWGWLIVGGMAFFALLFVVTTLAGLYGAKKVSDKMDKNWKDLGKRF